MGADYVSAITALVGMAAQALAHKQKIKQQKRDTNQDTAYDIGMEEAAALGAPGARFMQQAHDAQVHNSRLDRVPVDYGNSLSLLGRSLAGSGSSNSPDIDANNMVKAAPPPDQNDIIDPWAQDDVIKPTAQEPDWKGLDPWDDPEFRKNHPYAGGW